LEIIGGFYASISDFVRFDCNYRRLRRRCFFILLSETSCRKSCRFKTGASKLSDRFAICYNICARIFCSGYSHSPRICGDKTSSTACYSKPDQGNPAKLVIPECPKDPLAAWNYRTLVGAYLEHGARNPRWDQQAVDALYARACSLAGTGKFCADDSRSRCFAAESAGCVDPLVTYSLLREEEAFNGNTTEASAQDASMKKMCEGNYPPVRRVYSLLRTAEFHWKDEEDMTRLRTGQDLAEKALVQLEAAFKDPDPIPSLIANECCNDWLDLNKTLGGDRMKAYKRLAAMLDTSCKNESLKKAIEGRFYISYAWDARGSGWAKTVSDVGWKDFGDRIGMAKQALEAAYQLDSKNAEAAKYMITVALAANLPRAEMETWFKRAIELTPEDQNIYNNKMNYLQPRWHGSAEELLTFGRECVDKLSSGKLMNSKIAMILPLCHENLSQDWYSANPDAKDKWMYWKTPPVWNDLKNAYDAMLKLHPASPMIHTRYMRAAIFCSEWDEYKRQWEFVAFKCGGQFPSSVFGGAGELSSYLIYAREQFEKYDKERKAK
jgi:hypothetical protein